jgi:zinc protease
MSSSRVPAIVVAWICITVSVFGAPWRSVETDLPWDPAWKRGVLSNGLTFAVRRNAVPQKRISLRMLVSVGSLHENEDERGIAHFVEHMVFRGTRLYPGNELNLQLQRRGMGMGPDHTAFTGYDYTIYHLELPDTSDATLRFGLNALREYASGATFEPLAVQIERGVILNEKATRDVPEARRSEYNIDFLWPHSRHAQREVIGTEESLRAITREQLMAFYDAWYRPERIAIIAVGDADPKMMQDQITELFSGLRGRGHPRPEPTSLVPESASAPDVAIFRDEGMVGIELAFQHPVHRPAASNFKQYREKLFHRELAFDMFQRRLMRIAADAGDTMVAPSADVHSFVPEWETAIFTANGTIESWQKLAAAAEQEHRRAFIHGFSDSELKRTKEAFAEQFETHVRTAPSRRSDALASEMAGSLLHGHVLVAPEVLRDDVREVLANATPRDCLEAFREAWENKALHVLVSANSSFQIQKQEVADVLNASRRVQVGKSTGLELSDFAYQHFGSPGRLVQEQQVPDLDVRLAAFENHVKFNFKRTDFESDMVDASVRIQGGRLSAPLDKPGLCLLAEYGFTQGGLGRHRMAELRDLLAARSIFLDFYLEVDAFSFRLRSTRKDFLPLLQLTAAYITDAAFRAEALREASAAFNTSVASLLNTPGGLIRLRGAEVLVGADPRFAFPEAEEFYARTMQELKEWLQPHLASGAMEVSVVGDIAWEEARDAMAKTLGALPPRKARFDPTPAAPQFLKPPARPLRIPIRENFKQVALAWFWPIQDEMTVALERRCYLLAQTLQERLWKRLRDELGATYSPEVELVDFDGAPRLGYVVLAVEVDSEHANEAAVLIRKEIEALGRHGIGKEEFERVKAPILRAREDDVRENGYWCYTVLRDAQQRADRLTAARTRQKDTASIKASEIHRLFRRHITRQKGFFLVSEPGGEIRVWDGK